MQAYKPEHAEWCDTSVNVNSSAFVRPVHLDPPRWQSTNACSMNASLNTLHALPSSCRAHYNTYQRGRSAISRVSPHSARYSRSPKALPVIMHAHGALTLYQAPQRPSLTLPTQKPQQMTSWTGLLHSLRQGPLLGCYHSAPWRAVRALAQRWRT